MNKELHALVERTRGREMTQEELLEQKISFAYGNAPGNDTNTKETVRKALTESKVSRSQT